MAKWRNFRKSFAVGSEGVFLRLIGGGRDFEEDEFQETLLPWGLLEFNSGERKGLKKKHAGIDVFLKNAVQKGKNKLQWRSLLLSRSEGKHNKNAIMLSGIQQRDDFRQLASFWFSERDGNESFSAESNFWKATYLPPRNTAQGKMYVSSFWLHRSEIPLKTITLRWMAQSSVSYTRSWFQRLYISQVFRLSLENSQEQYKRVCS